MKTEHAFRLVTDPKYLEEQAWMQPILRKISIISPNVWTAMRIPLFLAGFLFHVLCAPIAAIFLNTLGILTDLIDGKVARFLNVCGKLGSVLDGSADKLLLLSIGWMSKDKYLLPMITLGVVDVFGMPIVRAITGDKIVTEHSMPGKIKFVLECVLYYVLWIMINVFPDWRWWELWISIFFSVIIYLAVFSVLCKISMNFQRYLADGLTFQNVGCGIASIFLTSSRIDFAAALIFIAGGFDMVDGYIARKTGGDALPFGDYKDSIADFVAFGLAPMVLITHLGISWYVSIFMAACTLVRLLYYLRVHSPGGIFQGLPCPAGGMIVASLALWEIQLPIWAIEITVVGVAILEISFFAEFFFKKVQLRWYHARLILKVIPQKFVVTIAIIIIMVAATFGAGEALSLLVSAYIVLMFKPINDWL